MTDLTDDEDDCVALTLKDDDDGGDVGRWCDFYLKATTYCSGWVQANIGEIGGCMGACNFLMAYGESVVMR